jgi:ubiquinone/menaquinone biosynthesis C-methylase UbiE
MPPPTLPPKQIVAQGYDRISRSYSALVDSMDPAVRKKYLAILEASLPPGARLLELGCGAGVPMTRQLARRLRVVGLELSAGQVRQACRNVPQASFVQGDMAELCFADGSFDAVAAFYSLTHVPRAEHHLVLAEAHRVLRPGGFLLVTTGAGDSPDSVEPDWLGAPMFFSHFDGAANVNLVQEAGFSIVSAEDEQEFEYGEPVWFRWIVARKATSPERTS